MKNMKLNLVNKLGEKLAVTLGQASINASEKAMGKCWVGWCYEPIIPLAILKENTDQ